jgi:hypothetical protein
LSPLPIKRAEAIAACSTTSIISKPKEFSILYIISRDFC